MFSRWRRFLLVLAAVLPVSFFASTQLAAAHVLKQDNGIAAVLHIPPEDNPEAGQPTELDLSFGDAKNVFSLQDCACKVQVEQGSRVLQSVVPHPALAGATLASASTVQFPSIGVYNVVVSGRALDGKFGSFSMNFLVRVSTSVNGSQMTSGNGGDVLIIGAGALAIMVMVGYTAIRYGGRYNVNKEKTS